MAPKKRALEEPAASAAGEAKKAHVENDTKEVSWPNFAVNLFVITTAMKFYSLSHALLIVLFSV